MNAQGWTKNDQQQEPKLPRREPARLRLNYVGRPWRTWYIIALASAAAICYDSLWAGVFVALATIDAGVESV